jgi:hypothetical protein
MQLAKDKPPTREQNLAGVRAAREQREKERKLNQAASTVQRAYRKYRLQAAIARVAKQRLTKCFSRLSLVECVVLAVQLREKDSIEFGAKLVAKSLSDSRFEESCRALPQTGLNLLLGFLLRSLLVAEKNPSFKGRLLAVCEAAVSTSAPSLQPLLCRFFLTTRNSLAAQLLSNSRRDSALAVLGFECDVALALLNGEVRDGSLPPAKNVFDALFQQESTSDLPPKLDVEVAELCKFCDANSEKLNPQACMHKLSRLLVHCPSQALCPLLQALGKICARIPEKDFLASMAQYLLKGSSTPLRTLFEESGLTAFCKMLMDATVSTAAVNNACYAYSLPFVQRSSSSIEDGRISSTLVSRLALKPNLINLLWNRISSADLLVTVHGVPRSVFAPVTMVFLATMTYIIDNNDFYVLVKNGVPFSAREVHQVVAKFAEATHRILMSGIAQGDQETKDVAIHACRMLSKLHTVDERISIVPSAAWNQRFSSAVSITVSDWADAEAASGDAQEPSFPSSRASSIEKMVSLLHNAPFLVPFSYRLEVLASVMIPERERFLSFGGRQEVTVQRGRVFEDAFQQLRSMPGEGLLRHFAVRFRNADGEMEAGFGDGVFREFLLTLCKEGFSPQYGLFCETEKHHVYPNPRSFEATGDPQHLERLRFLGAMVGKALRDGVLLDVPFASFFRNALLFRVNTVNDLAEYDSELHRGVSQIAESREAVEELMLTFSVTMEYLGVVEEIDLVPGGRSITVTPANLPLYILLLVDFKLNRVMAQQIGAFRAGLCSIVRKSLIRMFDGNELQLLFEGNESSVGLDVDDWMQHTHYRSDVERNSRAAAYFWATVRGMTPAQQRQTLKFVTSFSRAPLLGFRHMAPPFSIILLQGEKDRLPSAATCYCTLKLPEYDSLEIARDKILKAVEGTNSFDFS